MLRSQKRLLALMVSLAVLLVVAAVLYMLGMAYLEGEERDFWQALGFAAETVSTTGYGADETWQSPAMTMFVILLQFLGVFLIFLVFPVYLIPFLEERFEVRLPKEVPELSDHVIIYRYGPAVTTLLDELASAGVETLVIESDESVARRLIEQGHQVIAGSLDDGVLRKVSLNRARTLIANSTDDEDAAVILGARQLGYEGEALALVEEPFHRKPIMLAGATATYTPNHVLGAALAARASQRVSPTVTDAQHLGKGLQVSEVRIPRGSSLAGQTLARGWSGAPDRSQRHRPMGGGTVGDSTHRQNATRAGWNRDSGGQCGERPAVRRAVRRGSAAAAFGSLCGGGLWRSRQER